MKSLINFSEEQHRQNLNRRHTRGTIYENLYRLSLLLAIVALVTLLIQVSNQAFGPVLIVPVTPPDELADVPLEDLTEEQLAQILVDELGVGYINLVRDAFGRIEGIDFLTSPMDESFQGSTLPSEIDAETMTFNDLTDEQRVEILVLNASHARLLDWVNSEIVGKDVILEWSWLTGLFNNERVVRESAIELSSDIAREALRAVDDDFTAEDLAVHLDEAVGTDNALPVAESFLAVTPILTETEWDPEGRLRRDTSLEISETRARQNPRLVNLRLADKIEPIMIETLEEAGVDTLSASLIAEEFALDIAEDNGIDELSSNDQRDVLAALMTPPFIEVLRNDEYPNAEITFYSWLSGDFLVTTGVNSVPELASLRVAILGSVWVMVITMITAFPLGVGAAIYLEEYATDNWLNNLIETNIRNLAGVPSIIYGLLGLAVFARALVWITSGALFTPGDADPATLNGRTVLSAGLTLSLLILPVIIINSQEAIRAVPSTIREASYGLGATKWQTIARQILPAAIPGILTGTILAFSRAVGETAPLIVVGAASSISADPTIFSKFTVIPIQIFQWTEESRPEYQHLAAAAIIVLLVLLIVLNSVAISLRNRYSKA